MKKSVKFLLLVLVFSLFIFLVTATLDSFNLSSPSNNTWTNNNQSTFTFNATSHINTTFSCEIFVDGVGYGVNTTVQNNTQTTITLNATIPEGSRSWYVNCTDVNGTNQSEIRVLNIDITNSTSIINSPSNNTWTTDDTPEINITLTDNLDGTINYTVYVDGTANTANAVSNNTLSAVTLSTLSNATHSVVVEALDEAGNRINSTLLVLNVDLVNPTSTINLPANGNITNDTSPFVNFTLVDNLDSLIEYSVLVNGSTDQSGNASNGTQTTVNLSALSDGTYSVIVQATDEAGNSVNSGEVNISIDTSVPSVSLTNPANGAAIGGNYDLTGTYSDGSDIKNVTYYYHNTSGDVISLGTNSTSPFSQTVNTSQLADGVYNFTASAIDNFLETANDTNFNVTVDNTAPTSLSFSLTDSTLTVGDSISGTCTGTDALDSSPTGTITSPGTSSTGTFTANCTVVDDAGNSAVTNTTYTVSAASTGAPRRRGGSGGGSSSTANTGTLSMSLTWRNLKPGTPSVIKLTNKDFGVTEIQLNVNKEVSNKRLTVKKLAQHPASVDKKIKGKVFKYLEIDKGFLNDEDVTESTIEFAVEKEWVENHSLDKDNIVMMRYIENKTKWEELETKLESQSDTEFRYASKTPGFSFFAIAERENAVDVEEVEDSEEEGNSEEEKEENQEELNQNQNNEENQEDTNSNQEKLENQESSENEQMEDSNKNKIIGTIILLILAGIFIFFYLQAQKGIGDSSFGKKKNKKNHKKENHQKNKSSLNNHKVVSVKKEKKTKEPKKFDKRAKEKYHKEHEKQKKAAENLINEDIFQKFEGRKK